MTSGRVRQRQVWIHLDGRVALVKGRRRGRWVREEFSLEDGLGAGLLLRHVLVSSRLLRAGRRCHLRIDWDPATLLVRMSADASRSSASSGGGEHTDALDELDPHAMVVRGDLDARSGRAIEAVVRRHDVDDLAASLGSARFEGRAQLDLGVLARSRRLLERLLVDISGRSGFLIDVSVSTVCVLRIEGGTVRDVRCAARVEPGAQVARMMSSLMTAAPPPAGPGRGRVTSDRRRWFSVHAPLDQLPAIRSACIATLPRSASADLHVMRSLAATGVGISDGPR
jgi:hypothetical protein